jgi:hypothetical protein
VFLLSRARILARALSTPSGIMPATPISGTAHSKAIRAELKERIAKLVRPPTLNVLIGT